MNIQTTSSRRFNPRHIACGAAILTALFGILPFRSFADEPPASSKVSSVAEVPLSDLDLSSPEGMRQARERLRTMAERVCSDSSGALELRSQPGFTACIDSTVGSALRGIDTFRHGRFMVRNSVTVGENVSLADLDLSTLEGAHLGRQRLESTARHVCNELARRPDLTYPLDYAACVHDTVAGALAQAEAIAAARNSRIAQRGAR